jgi:hypothetical protein
MEPCWPQSDAKYEIRDKSAPLPILNFADLLENQLHSSKSTPSFHVFISTWTDVTNKCSW